MKNSYWGTGIAQILPKEDSIVCDQHFQPLLQPSQPQKDELKNKSKKIAMRRTMLESFQDPKLQRKIDHGDMLNLSDCEMVEEGLVRQFCIALWCV